MPTGDQLHNHIGPLLVAFGSGALVALGVILVILWIREPSKAGPSRRRFRHRKGARPYKPTYIPLKEVRTHSYEGVAFLRAHVHRTTIPVLPITEILPKVEVQSVSVRSRR